VNKIWISPSTLQQKTKIITTSVTKKVFIMYTHDKFVGFCTKYLWRTCIQFSSLTIDLIEKCVHFNYKIVWKYLYKFRKKTIK